MKKQLLERLLPEVGTPSYIFDVDEFRDRVKLVKEQFGDGTELCFSIKANPFLTGALFGREGIAGGALGQCRTGNTWESASGQCGKTVQGAFGRRGKAVQSAFGQRGKAGENVFRQCENPVSLLGKVEVCSPGELTICERMGVPAQKIIFSGVNKTAEDIRRAMEYGSSRSSGSREIFTGGTVPAVREDGRDSGSRTALAEDAGCAAVCGVGTFTAESLRHVEMISRSALEHGRQVPVLVRVSDGGQFGMDEKDVLELFRHRDRYARIDFAGLHFFTGTQKRRPAQIIKELDYIADLADRIREETGSSMRRIEYGTGLAVDYFKENADELERERLAAIAEKVREIAEKYELTVEMGRFFAAPCGYYLTRVADTKTNGGISYAILDGGLHQLKYDGQLQGMQIPQICHIKSRGNPGRAYRLKNDCSQEGSHASENGCCLNSGYGPEDRPGGGNRCEKESCAGPGDPGSQRASSGVRKWTLAGSLCTTADILAREVEFDSLEVGDVLVFCRTGAYSATEGMAMLLSRELPAAALYSEAEGLRVIRPRMETAEFHMPGWAGN